VTSQVVILFSNASQIGKESTEGLGGDRIEFTVTGSDIIDFSFLDDMFDYAVLIRVNKYEPVYEIVNTDGFFTIAGIEEQFNKRQIKDKEYNLLYGSESAELFSIDSFLYNGRKTKPYGMFTSEHIGMNYMLFLVNNNYEYLSANTFLILGNTTDIIFERIVDELGRKNVKKIESAYSKISDHIGIREDAILLIAISIFLVLGSLIMLIYWWSLQFEDIKTVSHYFGLVNANTYIIRAFSIIIFLADAVILLLMRKREILYIVSTLVIVNITSILLLLPIVYNKKEERYNA
jgi:hypothetical protein